MLIGRQHPRPEYLRGAPGGRLQLLQTAAGAAGPGPLHARSPEPGARLLAWGSHHGRTFRVSHSPWIHCLGESPAPEPRPHRALHLLEWLGVGAGRSKSREL